MVPFLDIPIWLVALVSAAMFVLGLAGAVGAVLLLPADHFVRDGRKYFWDHHPVLRLAALVIRNVVGTAVIAAGIVMLFTPGQGLLTILLGLIMVTFPGKKILVRRIVDRPSIAMGLNRLRRRFGRPPLEFERAAGSVSCPIVTRP